MSLNNKIAARRQTSNGGAVIAASGLVLVAIITCFFAVGLDELAIVLISLVVLAIVVAAFLHARLAWALYVAAMLLSGDQLNVGGISILPEHVALIPLLFHAIVTKRTAHKRGLAPAAGLIGLWLAIATASALSAPQPFQSIRMTIWVATNLVAVWAVVRLGQRTATLIRDASVVICIGAILFLVAWATATLSSAGNEFVELDYASSVFRIKGTMLEPNLVASFSVLWLAVLYVFRAEIPRTLVLATTTLLSVCVLLTVTRTAWLPLAVLSVFLLLHRLSVAARVSLALSVAILGLLAFGSTDPSQSFDSGNILSVVSARIDTMFDFEGGTGAFRLSAASIALSEWLADGIFAGHGLNSFPQSHTTSLAGDGRLYLPVLPVSLLYDTGLFGALAFWAAFLWAWLHSPRGSWLFFASFILLASSTNPTWYAYPWVFAGLLLRAGPDYAPSGPLRVRSERTKSKEAIYA